MNLSRLSWQIPLCLLLTSPLWQGSLGRFLRLHQGPPVAVRQAAADSSFQLQGLVFTQARQGKDELVVRAAHLSGNNRSEYVLGQAEAERLGDTPTKISGGYAAYDTVTEILTVSDQVKVETSGLVISTDVLRYLTKYETVKSAADVAMVGQGLRLTGTSFRYNLNSGDLRIGARVKCLYTPVAQTPAS